MVRGLQGEEKFKKRNKRKRERERVRKGVWFEASFRDSYS
jgi:hypothetical protein